MQTDLSRLDRVENPVVEFAGVEFAMTFQQAFQQAVLLSCPDALPGAAAVAAPIPLPDERQFSFTTRYRKSHATLAWTIDDYAIRDANEEKLQVEFSAGDAGDETRWKLQCFFGSCHDDHKDFICLTLDLVSPGPARNAGMEISLVTPDGRKPCFKRVKCHQFKLQEENRSGIHVKVTRSYLNENAAQLVPGDKLTIQCKLSVFGETNTAVTEVRNGGAGGKTGQSQELTSSQLGRDLGKLLSDDAAEGGSGDDSDLTTLPFSLSSSSTSSASTSATTAATTTATDHFSASPSTNHSDVTLQVGSDAFPAHKAILAARSQVFASMFDHNMIEQQSNVVEIGDMDPLVMRHFLHFLYTGEHGAALDVQLAKDLFIAADKYQVQQLKTFCEAFMSKNLTPENVPYVMVLAHLHACADLKQHSMEFFCTCAGRVMECPAWEEVASAHPALINEALKVMAKRHAADPGAESPKKKLKFSPCFSPP